MTRIIYGDRIGKLGKIRLGCSAVLFDEKREKVLLTRRADNGQWCLPSGGTEAGESVTETCEREVWEETGLIVQVERLTSVFNSPDRLVVYSNGNQFQFVILNFEVRWKSGKPGLSNETTEIGFYSIPEIDSMDIFPHHRQFISDTLAGKDAAFIN
jgi:8-oxo-dGTP pyrophosphatase MutT (NUDIX family)